MVQSGNGNGLDADATTLPYPAGRSNRLGNNKIGHYLQANGEHLDKARKNTITYGQYDCSAAAHSLLCNARYFQLQFIPDAHHAYVVISSNYPRAGHYSPSDASRRHFLKSKTAIYFSAKRLRRHNSD